MMMTLIEENVFLVVTFRLQQIKTKKTVNCKAGVSHV